MTNETKTWIKKFVELHEKDINMKIRTIRNQIDALKNNESRLENQLPNLYVLYKRILYHKAQLDLLKVLKFTTI